MAIDEQLLTLLACPESREKLTLASQDALSSLNTKIGAGKVQNRAGRTLNKALEGGLVRADGRYLYPIINGVPNLLIEEAIPLG
ncbi:MAG: Trm112 family protein [Bradymonadia bacterium]